MKYTLDRFESKGKDRNDNHKLTAYFREYEQGNTGVYWAVKSLPRAGDSFDGTISVGEYGPRFTREYAGPVGNSFAGQFATGQPVTSSNNNDGQRQGMCINNAAAYVTHTTDPSNSATAATWATTVVEYARELYKRADLNAEPELPNTDLTDDINSDTLNDVFGVEIDKTLGVKSGSAQDTRSNR